MISRGLILLRDQHRNMEQQYQERLHALRSELRALQEERPSNSTRLMESTGSTHDRRRSPSSGQPLLVGIQRDVQHSTSRPQPSPHPAAAIPPSRHSGLSARDRDSGRRDRTKDREMPDIDPSRPYSSAATLGHPRAPLPRTLTPSRSPRSHSPHVSRHPSPQMSHGHPRAQSHDHPAALASSSSTGHEPSLSPTVTLAGSDAPSQPRSRRARSTLNRQLN
ncbi:hypothetical protein K439DRAFT_124190 [Ramaria rubella]|nr:hypothetical protein K439DRAFT_124190 [Ramaria rubella]